MPSRKQIDRVSLERRVHRRDPSVRTRDDEVRKYIEVYCSKIDPKYKIKAVEINAKRLLRYITPLGVTSTLRVNAGALVRLASELLVKKGVMNEAIPYRESCMCLGEVRFYERILARSLKFHEGPKHIQRV